MMEHQHPLAEPRGAHLEAGAVTGKGVIAEGPGAGVIWFRRIRIMLAIVENGFEHPPCILSLCRCQRWKPLAVLI